MSGLVGPGSRLLSPSKGKDLFLLPDLLEIHLFHYLNFIKNMKTTKGD